MPLFFNYKTFWLLIYSGRKWLISFSSLMPRDNQVVLELSRHHCKDPHCRIKDPHCNRQFHLTFLRFSGSGSTLLCSPKGLSCLRALHVQPSPYSTFHEYSCSINLQNIQGLVVCQSSSCVGGLDHNLLCRRTDNLLPFRDSYGHWALLQKQHQAVQ